MLLLAACSALLATGFGIVIPVFARRLHELDYGAAELGLLTGAYALAQLIAAPLLGNLADRIGRKPIILIALAGHLFCNLGYLVTDDLAVMVANRLLQGALEAGMVPAALAVVADLTPERQRGRWLGTVMASTGGAFVLGPVVGGVLFDLAGFAAPFAVSAGLGGLALFLAWTFLGESQTPALRNRNRLESMLAAQSRRGFIQILPKPMSTFAVLLLASFTPYFALSYVEPQFMFFAYDVLDWSTARVGLILGAYGLCLMLTQVTLGGISDSRFERRWVVAVGLIAVSAFFFGMTVGDSFVFILLAAALSGVGKGIMTPAVGAFLLELAAPHQRASVMGLKSSATALGAVAGPTLAFLTSGRIEPTTLFASAGVFVLLTALISALALRTTSAPRLEVEVDAYRLRSLAAGATLRGLTVQSAANRIY